MRSITVLTRNASICNPSALKHLVLDIELWRNTVDIQRYYLSQLTELIINSSHRDENIHTLNKMAIVKRFLFMIDYQIILPEMLQDLVSILKLLIKACWCGEILKLVCTFLINTLPKGNRI